MISERKLFSETIKEKKFHEDLRGSSVSDLDYQLRLKNFEKLFSNYEGLKQVAKVFSNGADVSLISNQYFNATVASFVNSFAGFLSIERALDQPIMLLEWMDVLGVSDSRKVLPNLGAESFGAVGSVKKMTGVLATGTSAYNIAIGFKLVPGSVTMVVTNTGGTKLTITDDRNGNLLAPAGKISAGSINYTTGAFAVTFGAGWTPATTDTYVLSAAEDIPADNAGGTQINRFKANVQYAEIKTNAEMLVGEADLIGLASAQKVLGIDINTFLGNKLTELYTKLINKVLVGFITGDYSGNTSTIEIRQAQTNYQDYQSGIQKFTGGLVKVDGALAAKSTKGVKASSYLVGKLVADLFRMTRITGLWVENTSTNYINDLIGYYDGVPVLRHSDVGDNDGYAIHKTPDGQMAPVARGLFLPLTNTPAVGNYNNPVQVAQGVYYQEGHKTIATELVQKFTVNQD